MTNLIMSFCKKKEVVLMPDNELMPNDSTNLVDQKTYDAVLKKFETWKNGEDK